MNLNLASDGTAAPAGLSLSVTSTTGSEPAGVQFSLAYPATLSNVTINAGPAATAAGKSVTCAGPSGSKTCLVTGSTSAAIANGVVAVVGWGSAPLTGTTLTSFQSNSGSSVSPDGTRLPTLVQTSITVPAPATPPSATPTLQGLSCSTTQLSPGSPAHCVVSLAAPAPPDGATILLSSSSSTVSVPSGIVLAGGLQQADFYVVQDVLSPSPAATLSATYGTQTVTASLTLATPMPVLQGVACASTQITPAAPVKCTVVLTGPAPAGGVTVLLSSNNPALTVPSGIVLAAGVSQADFLVAQNALTTTTAATLRAIYGTQTSTAAVTLASPAPAATLQRVTCSATQLVPGTTVRCTVALTGPAPATGATVALSSSNAALSVPGSLVVAAGQSQADFSVIQTTLTTATDAAVKVTYGSQAASVAFTLTAPAPVLQKLTCAATQLTLSASSKCTVVLSGPAPASGAMVLFSSNNSALSVPSGIAIAAGLAQGDFYVVQASLTNDKNATLKATYSGKSLTVPFKLSSR